MDAHGGCTHSRPWPAVGSRRVPGGAGHALLGTQKARAARRFARVSRLG